jgi:inner membrane protein
VDSLTHAFTGIAVAHAVGREPPSSRTIAAAVVAANIADVDWWAASRSMSAYFEMHRGIAHSIVAVPVLAGLVAAVFHVRAGAEAVRPRFAPLAYVCLLAAATHLLLDALNPYGLRPLLPFTTTWYYGDLVAIPDPWIWLTLGGTALLLTARSDATTQIAAVVGGIVSFGALQAIPRVGTFGAVAGLFWVAVAAIVLGCWIRGVGEAARRGIAGAGLAGVAAYVAGVSVVHQYALGKAQDTAQGLARDSGEQVVRVAAIPTIGDLTTWRGLADTGRNIYRFPVRLDDDAAVPLERFTALPVLKSGNPAAVWSEPAIRAFLSFARFAAGSVEDDQGKRMLLLADPRFDFAQPGQPGTWPVRRPLDP